MPSRDSLYAARLWGVYTMGINASTVTNQHFPNIIGYASQVYEPTIVRMPQLQWNMHTCMHWCPTFIRLLLVENELNSLEKFFFWQQSSGFDSEQRWKLPPTCQRCKHVRGSFHCCWRICVVLFWWHTVRSGAEERTFWGARLDVLIFRLRSYHVLISYSAESNGPKFFKTLMFLGQAGMFLSFQARRSSATRSSTSDLTVKP